MKNICVFCGSSMGFDKRYAEAAARLGDVLADNSCTLYYGGGSVGLMNVIADKMLKRGCEVVGVMPDFLLAHEIGHPSITKMIPTKTMAERKDILMRESDAFIAMPGGFGTLDEMDRQGSARRIHPRRSQQKHHRVRRSEGIVFTNERIQSGQNGEVDTRY